jgi:DNA polymerase-4
MVRCVLFAEVPGFYAAVARADDPTLAGRPVLVGGDPRKRGRVQSATLDAFASGVALEMPILEALRHCPQARAVRTDMARYREVSRRLFALLRGVEVHLETFGLSACYADVTARQGEAESLANRAIEVVGEALELPLRVGIAPGKFLARLAAEEVAGERGVVRVAPGAEQTFLDPLPIERLDGVGRKTAASLVAMGARTIADVRALGRARLQAEYGPPGLRVHACAQGGFEEPVRAERHPKSLSRESTLGGDSSDVAVFVDLLAGLAQQLEEELGRQCLAAGRVAVKVRFADHGATTRSATLPRPTGSAAALHAAANRLLERTQAGARPVRGLGIQLSLLAPVGEADRQLDLFPPD